MKAWKNGVVAGLMGWSLVQGVQAGVPLNGLQGFGGVAFNPLAYPAGQNSDGGTNSSWLSKPQFGVWYVSLSDAEVDWTSIGVAETLFGRLELSYAYEVIAPPVENVKKHDVGAKLSLIPENWGNRAYVPAVSIGTVWKGTDPVAEGSDDSAFDLYAVATKLVTQTPKPILLSAGILSTKEQVTGVFGYNDDSDVTLFGNIDVLPLSNLAIGFEYKQGASFDSFKNADYWDIHAAWFATRNLTLVAAYVNAGDVASTSKTGVGEGLALSAQYAF